MPRNERTPFSFRPEGPRDPAERRNARAQHEATNRDFKNQVAGTPPWENPDVLAFIASLSADETPKPVSEKRVKARTPAKERTSRQPIKDAERLFDRIETLKRSMTITDPKDASETYDETIEELGAIIAGLRENSNDPELIRALQALERRFL